MECVQKNDSLRRRTDLALIGCAALLFLFLNVFLATRHEAWRDEAQAWLLAKNTTLPQLIAAMKGDGHPPLWHLFLRPFAKLGFPYEYLSAISLTLVFFGVLLLLFRAPFPPIVRCIAVFSSVFCYFNPVIARVYALIVPLVLLLAVMWKQKYERPILYGVLIALLFQTHIIMAGLAGGLMLCMGIRFLKKEGRTVRQFVGTLLPFISMCLVVLLLFQKSGDDVSVSVSLSSVLSSLSLDNLECGLCITLSMIVKIPITISIRYYELAVFLVFIAALLVILLRKQLPVLWEELLVVFCGEFVFLFVVSFIYLGTMQMKTLFFLNIVFGIWIICTSTDDRFVRGFFLTLLSVLSLLSVFVWAKDAKNDVQRPYSAAAELNSFIVNELPENSVILMQYDCYDVSVFAEVKPHREDIIFYQIDSGEEFSYHTWGHKYPEKTARDLTELADTKFSGRDVYYLRSNYDEVYFIDSDLPVVWCTEQHAIIDEEFTLFSVT